MAYYKGTIQRSLLVDKLVELLTTAPTGSTEPYWKRVSSGTYQNEGYILKSTGKSGLDEIFIRFRPTTVTNYLPMSVLEKYIPSDVAGLNGVITNESAQANIYFHSTTYMDTYPVEYNLSFDRNKIIMTLQGSNAPTSGQYARTLLWAGMPERISTDDKTNGAVTIACSRSADSITGNAGHTQHSKCRMLKNRLQSTNALTNMVYPNLNIGRTKGWGDTVFLADMYLEDSGGIEGVRAIMDGIYPIFQNAYALDFKNGDEIVRNAKRYIVYQVAYDGVNDAVLISPNCFPSTWMAIEKIQ